MDFVQEIYLNASPIQKKGYHDGEDAKMYKDGGKRVCKKWNLVCTFSGVLYAKSLEFRLVS